MASGIEIESAVMELLSDLAQTGSATPPDLAAPLPFLRIRGLGVGFHVDVEAFCATRRAARTLAERCRQRLLDVPHVTPPGVIDSVEADTRLQEVSWGERHVRRYVATYSVHVAD